MGRWMVIVVVACAANFFAGCTNNILVTKNGERYFVATKDKGLKKLLCDSGDMTLILQSAELRKPLEEQLYTGICGDNTSREKILELFAGMTKEERSKFKFAFQLNGYDVNKVLC